MAVELRGNGSSLVRMAAAVRGVAGDASVTRFQEQC